MCSGVLSCLVFFVVFHRDACFVDDTLVTCFPVAGVCGNEDTTHETHISVTNKNKQKRKKEERHETQCIISHHLKNVMLLYIKFQQVRDWVK